MNDASKPTTEKMMVQEECSVRTFIMIEKVRIWLPITNTKKMSWATSSVLRPILPIRISPASAMLCTWTWRHLNCPMVYAVYVEIVPTPKMVRMPLNKQVSSAFAVNGEETVRNKT